MIRRVAYSALSLLFLLPGMLFAGGPLLVGGPATGIDGTPMTWANGVVNYRLDGGNFTGGNTNLSNSVGASRVAAMFSVWSSVPTASITATNVGPIQSTGAFVDGDVSTVPEFDAVMGSCDSAQQTPVIFDASGAIFSSVVGDPSVIGIAGPCANDSSGHITSGFALLNGSFLDGIDTSNNYEISSAVFDEAITHELGHLLGLDHSQISVEIYEGLSPCSSDARAALPLMFPIFSCDARVNYGLPKLSPDDIAWISKLYPAPSFNSNYGVISGRIYFSDGISGTQGVNVIARDVSNPKKVAFSVVSGFLLTGNPGQNVTGDNPGSDFGSRDAMYEGYYEIPVPAGTYTIEVQSINSDFSSGSSVGPLSEPIPNPGSIEFWNDTESAADDPLASTPVTVAAGSQVSGKDIILNGTAPRFDDDEDEQ